MLDKDKEPNWTDKSRYCVYFYMGFNNTNNTVTILDFDLFLRARTARETQAS